MLHHWKPKSPYRALLYSNYTEIPSSQTDEACGLFSLLLFCDQPVKLWPAAALWTLFTEFCAQSLARCQTKPFTLWKMYKDVMGRLSGSQTAVCSGRDPCMCVYVSHTTMWITSSGSVCLLHSQLWSWHAKLALNFLLAAAPKMFPSCSALYKNTLIPCWGWTNCEVFQVRMQKHYFFLSSKKNLIVSSVWSRADTAPAVALCLLAAALIRCELH